MNQVFIGLGGNLGNKRENIENAIKLIEERIGAVKQKSNIYQSPPFGFESNDDFYNSCIEVSTTQSPEQVLNHTQLIEQHLGRSNKSSNGIYSSRIIDLDILFFNDLIIQTESLVIPHPKLHERKFVLLPLIEIAKSKIHPVTHMSILQILENCVDESSINTVQ